MHGLLRRVAVSLSLVLVSSALACSAVSEAPSSPKKPPKVADGGVGGGDIGLFGDFGAGGEGAAVGAGGLTSDGTVVLDLGPVAIGQPITVDVPAYTLGFNVVVISEGVGKVGIQQLATPSGALLVDRFTPAGGDYPMGEGYGGVASLSIPQSDRPEALAIAPGPWKLTVAGEGTNPRVRVRVQTTVDGAFHGGRLDLHIHLPAGLRMPRAGVVSAQTAAAAPAIVERVNGFFGLLESRLGIDRGQVTFHDAPAKYVRVDDYDLAYAASTELTKGQPEEHAVHLLLTNSLVNGELLGLATGLPGAAATTGTEISLVVAAFYDDVPSSFADSFTWLHEIGHFVGLNHTSEEDGRSFNLLGDTGQCTIDRTRGGSACCPDDGNLMSTGLNDGQALVTPGQRAIYRGSPIFRAYRSEEERNLRRYAIRGEAPFAGPDDARFDPGPHRLCGHLRGR